MDNELESKDLWTRLKKIKAVEAFKSIKQLKDENGMILKKLHLFLRSISSKEN